MTIATAYACADCGTLGESSQQCDCGSKQLWPLAKWLDRKQEVRGETHETGTSIDYRAGIVS
jgi:hypothetical protein